MIRWWRDHIVIGFYPERRKMLWAGRTYYDGGWLYGLRIGTFAASYSPSGGMNRSAS